jgi:putative ABC transport system permease protein
MSILSTPITFKIFFVGMFIVYTSIGMAYDQRNQTIKILKVIGVERMLINLSLTIELLTIALFSGALGAFGGFLLAQKLLPDINNTVSTLYNSPVNGKIDLSISWLMYSILIAGLKGQFSHLQDCYKVLKLCYLCQEEVSGLAENRQKPRARQKTVRS